MAVSRARVSAAGTGPKHEMLDRTIAALMRRLEGVIGLMLALMVVLVFGNVVLRYGFNSADRQVPRAADAARNNA